MERNPDVNYDTKNVQKCILKQRTVISVFISASIVIKTQKFLNKATFTCL